MLLLLTGASGAGKSTARHAVARELSPEIECVELRDVVALPAFPTIAWRQQATEAVVRRALEFQSQGRHLLLGGDPVAAGEVLAAPSAAELDSIAVCLLDVRPEAQTARLTERGDDPALLADRVIDTSELTKEDVANEALTWCRQAVAGRAPVLGTRD